MSKKVKVVVSTPAPWKRTGGYFVTVRTPLGLEARGFRQTTEELWFVVIEGKESRVKNPDIGIVQYLKAILRDRLLAELTALHDEAPDGDAKGGTERVEPAEIIRIEG